MLNLYKLLVITGLFSLAGCSGKSSDKQMQVDQQLAPRENTEMPLGNASPSSGFVVSSPVPVKAFSANCDENVVLFGEKTINVSYFDVMGVERTEAVVFRALPYSEHGCMDDGSRYSLSFQKKENSRITFSAIFEVVPIENEYTFKFIRITSDCVEKITEPYIDYYRKIPVTIDAQTENALRKVVMEKYCPAQEAALTKELLIAFKAKP